MIRLALLGLGISIALSPARAGRAPREERCHALLRTAWADDYTGDAESQREIKARLGALPCRLALDVDGDRKRDAVSIVAGRKGTVELEVRFVKGGRNLLGGGKPRRFLDPQGRPAEAFADFSFLHAWRPAPLVKGRFRVTVLGKPRGFAAPDARGDGIWVSGGDSSAILYLGRDGRWHILALGY